MDGRTRDELRTPSVRPTPKETRSSLLASTDATILAHRIASTSTMAWPTTALVSHAWTCRMCCRMEETPTHRTRRYDAPD